MSISPTILIDYEKYSPQILCLECVAFIPAGLAYR